MDDWELEKNADKLSDALSYLHAYKETVTKLVKRIDVLEQEKANQLQAYIELDASHADLRDKFQEMEDQLVEALQENLGHLETIQSLQT